MPVTGKKRARKAEEDASKKKPKAGAAEEPTRSPQLSPPRAAVTPSLTSPSPAPMRKGTLSKTANSAPKEEDTLGNPYEAPRAPTSSIANSKKQEAPLTKKSATLAAAPLETEPVLTNGTACSSRIKGSQDKSKRSRTSIPCILLFFVAILMWCTVALVGLLLSERMDHELQMWTLRDMLHKSESVQVPSPPEVEELQKNVHFWKGRAQQLESQKKGMMQEFGEKISSLEYME